MPQWDKQQAESQQGDRLLTGAGAAPTAEQGNKLDTERVVKIFNTASAARLAANTCFGRPPAVEWPKRALA
jgi:hypothetical protein